MSESAALPQTSPSVSGAVAPLPGADTAPRTGKVAKGKPVADTRTPAEIEADLVATRARLAGRIDELSAYVAPKAVARRQVDKVKSFYVDEFGGIRPERVLATAGVAVAVLGLLVLRRRRR